MIKEDSEELLARLFGDPSLLTLFTRERIAVASHQLTLASGSSSQIWRESRNWRQSSSKPITFQKGLTPDVSQL